MTDTQPINDNDNNRRFDAKVEVKVDSPVTVNVIVCAGGDKQVEGILARLFSK